jgi:hypothetical protein
MSESNVIQALTKYAVGSRQDPRENRLTAALATVLDLSPVIARRVLREWGVDFPARSSVTVSPQRPVPVGFIDLELTGGGARVWVEVKLGSPLSGDDQLHKYQRALKQTTGRPKALLLLVPAYQRAHFASLADGYSPADGPIPRMVTWQETYAAVRKAAGQLTSGSPAEWFTQQFLEFLEMEDLMEVEKLTRTHITTLRDIKAAWTALDELLGEAHDRLEARGWRPAPQRRYQDRANPAYVEYFVKAGAGWARNSLFCWGVDGERAFASVYGRLDPGPLSKRADNQAWLAHAAARRWKSEADTREYGYWTKYEPLLSAAKGRTSEQQATALAHWVGDAFDEFGKSADAKRRA